MRNYPHESQGKRTAGQSEEGQTKTQRSESSEEEKTEGVEREEEVAAERGGSENSSQSVLKSE